ncbi:hypothetical protein CHLRE_01g020575v5 [Chlamydomonas reinhardtii]|uniref:Uncharacterized protein n=1 Tax=Chlamydomonas reinhardtii TaxID=3055 RepID=A8HPU8_CHLRE|nr:uncharacterized protein CHLRE_01g020575v5 [Chlamydomonas reinhardtii]PNW88235.1 hypothetical protein CHLRE_01g020575v5 [Chlamydomonas reinhardtii]|eukprot:XP_001689955.1 heat shock protein 22D [Chlamydomonas reinhardtii]
MALSVTVLHVVNNVAARAGRCQTLPNACVPPQRPQPGHSSPQPALASPSHLARRMLDPARLFLGSSFSPLMDFGFGDLDRYELQAYCPGMAKQDVVVELTPDNVICINGSHKAKLVTPAPQLPKPEAAAAAGEAAANSDAEDPARPAAPAAEAAAAEPEMLGTYRFSRSFGLPEDADV